MTPDLIKSSIFAFRVCIRRGSRKVAEPLRNHFNHILYYFIVCDSIQIFNLLRLCVFAALRENFNFTAPHFIGKQGNRSILLDMHFSVLKIYL